MSDDPMVAVLREHRVILSGDDDGWHVVCSCGFNELSSETTPHLADVLRAAGYIHRDEQGTSAKHNKRGDLLREVCCVCGDAFFVCTGCDVAMCECSRDGDCAATPPDHACDERCDHLGEWLGGGAR